MAALDHIYVNSSNLQRRLTVINGIGDAETQQAVEVLQQILNDESDVQIVAAAVRALGDTDLETAVLALLRRNSPSFTEAEELARVAGWTGNASKLVGKLRQAGYKVETAREARRVDPSIPKGQTGYRIRHS